MTTISIIIPTYNAGQYIKEALASVLAQSFQDFEVIIIDDGSTDDTAQKVKTLCDPRILYVYKENQGPAAARNYGLNLVRGEYIAFLDVDDLWEPHKLEMHFLPEIDSTQYSADELKEKVFSIMWDHYSRFDHQ